MIQLIGIIEVILFYAAYFYKLLNQKRKGIKTNQLGKGNKSRKAFIVESLLKISTVLIAAIMFISALLNVSMFTGQPIRLTGLVLSGLGTCLFIIAMATMRDSWRAGIPDKDKTEMVTSGIYKVSRNPAFLGFDLTYIGACLTFGNMVMLVAAVFTIIMMHLQILEEEKYLESTFGGSYTAYKKKVGRYFSFL
ncbi:methyltransferase family protein [Anaerocolumna jejuensis]|uniref:methyltransferase family protein n=1 Tax=Anaerocolumna jejuensis TaxID=259063 RepID=UPI003F7C7B09